MAKKKRIIWTNENLDESYSDDCWQWLDDERHNLNINIDGCIVAFASLGLWNGTHQGSKVVGDNVCDILYSDCDYVTWFCDRYNVRCDATHHDGSNHILYRVAKNREHAKKLAYKIAYEGMCEEDFRKATRSLRPFIAKVYGW